MAEEEQKLVSETFLSIYDLGRHIKTPRFFVEYTRFGSISELKSSDTLRVYGSKDLEKFIGAGGEKYFNAMFSPSHSDPERVLGNLPSPPTDLSQFILQQLSGMGQADFPVKVFGYDNAYAPHSFLNKNFKPFELYVKDTHLENFRQNLERIVGNNYPDLPLTSSQTT